MTSIAIDNRPLKIAITVSVLAHALLLAMKFHSPESFRLKPSDDNLEVILVNSKHARAPLKASAVAQANLDGGGKADSGRATSPLPNMQKDVSGDSLAMLRRQATEEEEYRAKLLTQYRASPLKANPVTDRDKPDPKGQGQDPKEVQRLLARMEAELSRDMSDQNKRPQKTFLAPSTMAVGYALYYKDMEKRIEDIGTLNFPQKGGRKLYGDVRLAIPVFQDGTIYLREGGIKIVASSGNRDLDQAAVNIVKRAAPFGHFPKNMLSHKNDDLWVLNTTFHFRRSDKLDMQLMETPQ